MAKLTYRMVLLPALLLMAACGQHGGGGQAAAAAGDSRVLTATIGYPEPHTVFAPGGGGGGPAFSSSKVLERLARQNADQTYSPVLATGWTIAPDGKSVDIKLREGVRWHDGKPLTADDVAFSITDYWKPFYPGTILGFLQSVDIAGPNEVVLRFARPVPEVSVLQLLSGIANYILPKHIYAGQDILTNPANAAPVGTGPWKFSKWVRGSYEEFVRNPDYWVKDEPKLDRLIIRWWRESASRAAAIETGEVDIGVSNPAPLGDIARLQKDPNLEVRFEQLTSPVGLHFNVRNPIFSDRRVRQALLHAIDRDYIVKTIYYGLARPGISPIPSSNPLYFTADVPRYDYDPAKAARLLDQAGYPVKADGKRFKMNLLASGWSEENGKVGAYLKQVFSDLNIDTTLRVPDRPNSLKSLYTDHDFDVAYSQGGGVTTDDPVPEFTLAVTKAGDVKGLVFRNASGYSTPVVEDLVQRLTIETDPGKRHDLIQRFARVIVTDAPVFPLVEWRNHLILRKSVHLNSTAENIYADSWADVWKDK